MMILLIFLTAFAMEAIGTYISVIGLGSLFANDPIILTMACIFDIAKIVSVSVLYQNWQYIKGVMRYYMLTAIIVLMVITSGGVFGYLSGSFQKALQPNMEVALKVDSYNRERTQLVTERAELQVQRLNIDAQIANVKSEDVDVKRRLMRSFKPESTRISERTIVLAKRIDELNEMVLKVESENIEKQVHAGPIIYVAKAFNVSIDQAAKWIILTIIFVFDPLAVILILAGNLLVKKRKEENDLPTDIHPTPSPKDIKSEKQPEVESSEAPEKMLIVEPSINSEVSNLVPRPTDNLLLQPKQETIVEPFVTTSILKSWGNTPSVEYGTRVEDVSTPYMLPAKQNEFEWLDNVYDGFDLNEAPDSLYVGEEPSDDYELVVEEYIPVEPISNTVEQIIPIIQEPIEVEETPNGLNVQELIEAAKKRVNKKRASPTKIEPITEEAPKYNGPLMTSSLESLKIGTAGAMLGSGHPASHTRGIYQ